MGLEKAPSLVNISCGPMALLYILVCRAEALRNLGHFLCFSNNTLVVESSCYMDIPVGNLTKVLRENAVLDIFGKVALRGIVELS